LPAKAKQGGPVNTYNMQDSKTSLKDGKNPQTEGYRSLVSESLTTSDKAAQETFKDRSFRDEWRALYAASGVLRAIVSLGSFATLTMCITWGLSFRLPVALSWGVACGTGLVLEGAKGFLWTKSAKYILKYKSAPALLVIGAGLLTALSLIGGIGGALKAPTLHNEQADQIELDSAVAAMSPTEAGYLKQLDKLDQQAGDISGAIASTSSNSTKRTLSATQQVVNQERSKVSANLEQYRKDQTEKQRAERARQLLDEQTVQDKQAEEANQQRVIAILLAVLFDLLQIICFVWGVYYLWRVYAESVTSETGTPPEAPHAKKTQRDAEREDVMPNVQPRSFETRQIGFMQGKGSSTPNVTAEGTPNVTAEGTHGVVSNPARQRRCDWCGSVYSYKNSTSRFCTPKCRGKMHRYTNQKQSNG